MNTKRKVRSKKTADKGQPAERRLSLICLDGDNEVIGHILAVAARDLDIFKLAASI